MTEKEIFLQEWEREFQTNLKMLNALPENKLDIRPDPNLHTAKELAWSFVTEEKEFIGSGVEGRIDVTTNSRAPSTLEEIIRNYERAHQDNVQKVKAMNDADFNKSVKGVSSPRLKGDVRRADILWGGLMDGVHQRGQLSIYLNFAGAHVPQAMYAPITTPS